MSEEAYRAYEEFLLRQEWAFCAEQLLLAGVQSIDADQFSLAEPTLAGAQTIQIWAMQEQEKLRAELDRFDDLVSRRLALGVLLLEHGVIGEETRAAAGSLTALAEAVQLAIDARRLLRLAASTRRNPGSEAFTNSVCAPVNSVPVWNSIGPTRLGFFGRPLPLSVS